MPASKIAVIETRLPYTDRRALSEAWFSALHLARDPASAPPATGRKSRAVAFRNNAAPRATQRPVTAAAPDYHAVRSRARVAGRIACAGLDVPTRRSTDAPSAAASPAFERARSYPPFRTSLTLEGAGGTRVHLIVRRVGPILHVVALCPPAVEGLVRKALASADLHFRARGEQLRADINEATVRA